VAIPLLDSRGELGADASLLSICNAICSEKGLARKVHALMFYQFKLIFCSSQ